MFSMEAFVCYVRVVFYYTGLIWWFSIVFKYGGSVW